MAGIGRFSLVALDCTDPVELAKFYSKITGWEIGPADPAGDWVELRSHTGATIALQLAPNHVPPVWPSDDHQQQAHIDFDVPNLDIAEEQVLALGARKAEFQPGETWRVYLDPAGHPFCLVLDEEYR